MSLFTEGGRSVNFLRACEINTYPCGCFNLIRRVQGNECSPSPFMTPSLSIRVICAPTIHRTLNIAITLEASHLPCTCLFYAHAPRSDLASCPAGAASCGAYFLIGATIFTARVGCDRNSVSLPRLHASHNRSSYTIGPHILVHNRHDAKRGPRSAS
ncbi:hypothetical protein BC826DRAFT_154606 [Russula brevipes]|nr:hypothetical protein BC826DRAFT_154606 [Russula brevipes]